MGAPSLETKPAMVDPALAVPGAPLVCLRTDPEKKPGIVERVTGTTVTVFWIATGRRWPYDAKQLKVVR